MRKAVAALAAAGMLSLLTAEAHALRFVVDSTADARDADLGDRVCLSTAGGCTLRAAFEQANDFTFRVDTIELPAGTYALTGTNGVGAPLGGLINDRRSGPLEIVGAGPTQTIVVGPGTGSGFVVFDFASDTKVTGITIREGGAGGVDLSMSVNDNAGFFMQDCIVENNFKSGFGGGITSAGVVGPATFVRTLFRNNETDLDGGAMSLSAVRTDIIGSTFTGNIAARRGGGIQTGPMTTIVNATIVGNTAGEDGGGLVIGSSDVVVRNTTIANNTGPNQVALRGFAIAPMFQNTIVDGSCGTGIGGGVVTSAGGNLETGTTCNFTLASDRQNTNPMLEDFGPMSPADPLLVPSGLSQAVGLGLTGPCPLDDQRGALRDGSCDAGAVQVFPPLCFDVDADGFFVDTEPPITAGAKAFITCPGTVEPLDCDDADRLSNPGRLDVPANGRDDDCNGMVDDLDLQELLQGIVDGTVAALPVTGDVDVGNVVLLMRIVAGLALDC